MRRAALAVLRVMCVHSILLGHGSPGHLWACGVRGVTAPRREFGAMTCCRAPWVPAGSGGRLEGQLCWSDGANRTVILFIICSLSQLNGSLTPSIIFFKVPQIRVSSQGKAHLQCQATQCSSAPVAPVCSQCFQLMSTFRACIAANCLLSASFQFFRHERICGQKQ